MSSGDYQASLKKCHEVLERFPGTGDQAAFRMAIIHAYPRNKGRDYQKSLDCLQKVVTDYPQSDLRDEAETLIALITQVMDTEQRVRTLQKRREVLERQTDALENQIEQMKRIDLSTEERKRKRLER